MGQSTFKSDVLIVGGGIAGIITALELLNNNQSVILVDQAPFEKFGGLAKESFGGIFLVNSKYQKRTGIKDSVDLALKDWFHEADFSKEDHWPRQWAEAFVQNCTHAVGDYLNHHRVGFFPLVHWVEKGLYRPGNSVPRFHMVWGTGQELTLKFIQHLNQHKNRNKLQLLFQHKVTDLIFKNAAVEGCVVRNLISEEQFEIHAPITILANGGICGNIPMVKDHWYKAWGAPPEVLLNGSHPYADGSIHALASKFNAHVTHLDKIWNYAAGVHHPAPHFENHGLSLVPPKSALWMDAYGKRVGPTPLVTGFDTRHCVEAICQTKHKYSWQIFNYKIAIKELAVSGSESNEAIRDKNLILFLKTVLLGNKKLVQNLIDNCPDFIVANTVQDLATKMNTLTGQSLIDPHLLDAEIRQYDDNIARGPKFHNDDQLRRIAQSRQYRGDRARTCNFQKIVDDKAMPIIAVREFILSRKTLGGFKTNLNSEVLTPNDTTIPGLLAVGEAAGFGGGGMHGLRSLEGTFLGGCIYTARRAVQAICGGTL